MNDESEALASEASFLSKAGLLTLLAGTVVFAVAVLLGKPAEGGYIFAAAVSVSLCISASNYANSAVGKIEQLERQLSDAGVIKREDA